MLFVNIYGVNFIFLIRIRYIEFNDIVIGVIFIKKYIKKFYIWGIVVLLVISLGFFLQFRSSNQVHIKDIEKMADLSVQLVNEKINDWLNNRAQLIKDASNYIAVESHSDENILSYLKYLLEKNDEFASLYFTTPNNKMINASGWEMPKWFDARERPWYQKAVKQKELIFTKAFINASHDDIIITVAKPVYSRKNGQFKGVIAGDVSIDTIISYVEEHKTVENGFFMLIDSSNNVLAHPDFNYNLDEGIPKLNTDYVNSMNTEKKVNQERINIEKKEGYLSYVPVANTNWMLANFSPLDNYTETFNYLLRSFLFGLLTSIFILGAFLNLHNKHVIQPLRKFDEHIRNIDLENNLNYRLPTYNYQEFKFLSNSINNVLEKAQNYFKQLKDKKQSIKHLANHDPLTDLPNRRKFMEVLNKEIKQEKQGAVMLLDLDNFKDINDTMGHSYGDRVLKVISDRLKNIKKDKVFISRFGGDEFLILLKNKIKIEKINEYVKIIGKAFQESVILDNNEIHIEYSMGISRYPYDSENLNQLIANADTAMYRAKKSSKSQYVYFDQYMTDEIKEEKEIKEILRTAVQNNGFKLKYQPQINLNTGQADCYEALIRLKNYNITPGKFIPIAEEKGLIIEIGRWVTKNAVQQIANWQQKGWESKRISINLSPNQLNDINYIEYLKETIEDYEIDPSLLEIEITENILLESKQSSLNFLNRLKEVGVRIALDDFGKGYSSLSYLTFVPADKVKIDKSLNDQFISDEKFTTIDSLISLIHSLDLEVVAEGIESIKESEKLKNNHCDYIQGYVFSKPLNINEINKVYNTNYFELIN